MPGGGRECNQESNDGEGAHGGAVWLRNAETVKAQGSG
jgi:hypothetical protein